MRWAKVMSKYHCLKIPKIGTEPGLVLGSFLLLLAFYVFSVMGQSTSEFRGIGFVWPLFIVIAPSIFVIPLNLVAIICFSNIKSKFILKWFNGWFFVIVGICSIIFAIYSGYKYNSPTSRLKSRLGSIKIKADDIKVEGFNSFLATRWLYSFKTKESDVVAIAKHFNLKPFNEINLKNSLERDIYFGKKDIDIKKDVPGENASLAFVKVNQNIPSEWMTLVYSASLKRAWLYTGYQN